MFDLVQTSGEFGRPAMTISAPVYVQETQYRDATVGDGPRVTAESQDIAFDVTIARGATSEKVLSAGTQVQPLSSWRTDYDGLAQLMMCATEGSRIVGAVPASALSPAAAQNMGLADDESIVVTLDLTKVYLPAADGAPQYNDRPGMPSVVLAPDGRPGVIIPDANAPTDRAVETLKKGAGVALTAADTARVHYTAVDWDTRKVTDSTWADGAAVPVPPASSLAFASDLVGATVGSQLLIVVPAASADASATAYVVDILGIDAQATAQ